MVLTPTDVGDHFQSLRASNWSIAADSKPTDGFCLRLDCKLYADHVTKSSTLLYWLIGRNVYSLNIEFEDGEAILYLVNGELNRLHKTALGTMRTEVRHRISLFIGDLKDISYSLTTVIQRLDPDGAVLVTLSDSASLDGNIKSLIIGTGPLKKARVWGDAIGYQGRWQSVLTLTLPNIPPQAAIATKKQRFRPLAN